MSQVTSIEWTRSDDGIPGRTWNPVRGCSRVSEGCRNCYAERMAARFSGPGLWAEGIAENTPGGPRWTGRVELVRSKLAEPLSWRKPCRVFVNSMSDLFHEGLSNADIAAVFGVMAATPQHTYQVLTKRPERMRQWFAGGIDMRQCVVEARCTGGVNIGWPLILKGKWVEPIWPLPNVWLGVSVENQDTADQRIPLLLDTPAAVRFISAEPLLGPVDLTHDTPAGPLSYLLPTGYEDLGQAPRVLDWVIVGGESGPGARPMHPDWARRLRDQCAAAGTAFFFKQHGEHEPIHRGHSRPGDLVVWPDGDTHKLKGAEFAVSDAAAYVRRVGKTAAGRMLDGQEHSAFPGGAA